MKVQVNNVLRSLSQKSPALLLVATMINGNARANRWAREV
ncbi:hypothetical protein RR11_2346 [Ruegeria sp. R11]|nr:hypothetical protein RR11_2346 [Ruegeria sp. R11]